MDFIGIIAVVAILVVLAIIVLTVVGRFKVSSPNEALIVSGSQSKDAKSIIAESRVVLGGGRIFVMPIIQRLFRMSLESHKINLEVKEAVSKNNIIMNLNGVAMVKVGGNENDVRNAAQRFLGQQEEVRVYAQEVMEGALRSIVGTMTVEEIIRDRAGFASHVADAAVNELNQQGLILDTLTVQNVDTPSGYIINLGKPEAAKVSRAAAIAEAEAKRDSETAQAAADQRVAEAQKALALQLADIQSQTSEAEARAAASGPIAEAERRTEILEKERIAAEKRAEVRERELESEVRKPADAEAYAVQVAANAKRDADIANAEAEAKRVTLSGEAEAAATAARGNAEATVIQARGEAEARAIEARKEAYENYPQAGIFQMAMDGVPEIARAVAEPVSNIDSLTVVSTDGMNKVTHGTAQLLTQTSDTLKGITGFDIGDLATGILGGGLFGGSDKGETDTTVTDKVVDSTPAEDESAA